MFTKLKTFKGLTHDLWAEFVRKQTLISSLVSQFLLSDL